MFVISSFNKSIYLIFIIRRWSQVAANGNELIWLYTLADSGKNSMLVIYLQRIIYR